MVLLYLHKYPLLLELVHAFAVALELELGAKAGRGVVDVLGELAVYWVVLHRVIEGDDGLSAGVL